MRQDKESADYRPQDTETDPSQVPLQLAPPDGLTPDQVLHGDRKSKLPLPQQDREAAASKLQRQKYYRMSLLELMGLMLVISTILAASHWLRGEVFAVSAGGIVLLILFLEAWFDRRYHAILLTTFLVTYIASAAHLVWVGW